MHAGRSSADDALTVHYGEDDTVDADLMLVAVGRAPLVSGIGLEAAGVAFDARAGHPHRRAPSHLGRAHLRGRRLRRLLAARPHRLPRGRGRSRERLRPRGARRRAGRAAADLHRSRDRIGRPHRGAGARAPRRRDRGRRLPVGRQRARGHAGRDDRLRQVDPRDALRRAARPRHRRPARDRPDRGGRGRARRRVDRRDGRRRDRAAPDALGGDQGGRAASRSGGRSTSPTGSAAPRPEHARACQAAPDGAVVQARRILSRGAGRARGSALPRERTGGPR